MRLRAVKQGGKSTGPRSAAGKAVSSGNGITHGCTARVFRMVEGEDKAELDELVRSWEQGYEDVLEGDANFRSLLRMAAEAEWLLWRNQRRFGWVDSELGDDLTKWTEEQHAQLQQATRYLTTAERRFQRFRQAVEQMRRSRHLEEHREEMRERQEKHETHRDEDRAAKQAAGQRKAGEQGPVQDEQAVEAAVAKWEETTRNRQPLVRQTVEAKQREGAWVVRKMPPNAEVLKRGLAMDPPARQVMRVLALPQDLPDEYAWIETAESGTSLRRVQLMTFETWRENAEWEERELGEHVGPVKREQYWRRTRK